MQDYIKIHPKDQVAVALRPLDEGSVFVIDGAEITLREPIPQGHKFALCAIAAGSPVIKYGSPIGVAKKAIEAGSWVHTHNLQTGLGELLDYTWEPVRKADAAAPGAHSDSSGNAGAANAAAMNSGNCNITAAASDEASDSGSKADCQHGRSGFMGYRRPDGRVGVRNEIWIIPTVGCVNSVASAIERRAQIYKNGSIDAIAAFRHPYGCSQMGEDQENTRRILAGLIRHPNAGGVLVLGLGCENSNIDMLKNYLGDYDKNRVKFLVCQESENETEDALRLIEELAETAGAYRREPIAADELIVGLKCGGSDGLSGITANPAVGVFSDLLTAQGGTTILTEVPEMFGAETLLMNRCETEELFDQTVALINDFKQYLKRYGQTIYENPSPGNKKGGISTLEDKALGCTQKSGQSPVRGVLPYGAQVCARGLNLLCAPGNDLVASTALAAAGAQIVLFTTGRGTPFSCPVPTVKISSNTALSQHKSNWIDFNCGTAVGGRTIASLGSDLYSYVMDVASGRPVKSEEAGYRDMAIFKQGVTL